MKFREGSNKHLLTPNLFFLCYYCQKKTFKMRCPFSRRRHLFTVVHICKPGLSVNKCKSKVLLKYRFLSLNIWPLEPWKWITERVQKTWEGKEIIPKVAEPYSKKIETESIFKQWASYLWALGTSKSQCKSQEIYFMVNLSNFFTTMNAHIGVFHVWINRYDINN